MTSKPDTIISVVYLRAIAALAVCAIHFRLNTGITINKFVDYLIVNGHQGVTVFFVISGFILPFSLYKKQYKIQEFFKFLLKRSVRVDIPFWFSIVLLFTIGFYPLNAIHFDTLLYHITYTIPFVKGQHWFTDVYWTLSIEFQFYLILGLSFPLLMKAPKYLVIILLTVISFYCLQFTVRWFIISYVYQFVFGFIAFMGYTKMIKLRNFLVILLTYTLLICCYKSIMSGCIPFLTVITIMFVKPRKKEPVSYFLGTISYSIYLIHVPIIAFIRHVLKDYQLSPIELCGLFITIIIPTAYLMYLVVEKPAISLSKSVNIKPAIN